MKTGFRHALGGYSAISSVTPDLVVYGKAIANGYPISVIAGKSELMDLFIDPNPASRVLLAGTYNAHPVLTAAAIATIERLAEDDGATYRHLEYLGAQMQSGLEELFRKDGATAVVGRQGSAFCTYFMDHLPVDWHDVASNNDAEMDARLHRKLLHFGVYFFQLPMKQCSISVAHTITDVEATLAAVQHSLEEFCVSDDRNPCRIYKLGS